MAKPLYRCEREHVVEARGKSTTFKSQWNPRNELGLMMLLNAASQALVFDCQVKARDEEMLIDGVRYEWPK